MNELLTRWRLESPKFFTEIAYFGKLIVSIGGIVMASCLAAPETIAPAVLGWMKLISSYMIFGGGIVVAIANLTVSDPDKLKEKLHEKADQ